MPLSERKWEPVSVFEVLGRFLFAERGRWPLTPRQRNAAEDKNSRDPKLNRIRWRAIFERRCALLLEIPPDTQWFRVGPIDLEDIGEFRIIARCGWDVYASPSYTINETLNNINFQVDPGKTVRSMASCISHSHLDRSSIFFAHSKKGPFSVLEGNKRWCAVALSKRGEEILQDHILIYVGLSPNLCSWHCEDDIRYLIAQGPYCE